MLDFQRLEHLSCKISPVMSLFCNRCENTLTLSHGPVGGRRAHPSGGSALVGRAHRGGPRPSRADRRARRVGPCPLEAALRAAPLTIFVLKSRRFGKRGGGLCAHRAGPSVADGRTRRAGPRPSRANGRARQAGLRPSEAALRPAPLAHIFGHYTKISFILVCE